MTSHDGDLHAQTDTDTGEGLVADPVGGVDADVESIAETAADSADGRTYRHERNPVSRASDHKAGDDTEKAADNDGQVVHAGGEGVGTLNGLKVDGQVVDEGEETARDEKDIGIGGPDAANLENAGL